MPSEWIEPILDLVTKAKARGPLSQQDRADCKEKLEVRHRLSPISDAPDSTDKPT